MDVKYPARRKRRGGGGDAGDRDRHAAVGQVDAVDELHRDEHAIDRVGAPREDAVEPESFDDVDCLQVLREHGRRILLEPASYGEDRAVDLSLIVTSADFQAMYAANRLISLLKKTSAKSGIALVVNGSVSSFEDSFVEDFAGQVGLTVVAAIPRSFAVRHSELYGKTVIEAGPLSTHAYAYKGLARQIVEDGFARSGRKAKPLDAATLKEWAHEWGRRLGELEFGIISDGAGI